jgi:chromosome segregation ATPase
MLKYQKKLDDFEIKSLDDEVLDAAFVVKAKELEQKIANKSLSDEEIEAIDNELCTLFDEVHDFEEVPSDEVTQLQRQNTILQGKQKVEKEKSIDGMLLLIDEYKDYPEVLETANEKLNSIQEAQKQAEEKKKEAEEKKKEAEQKQMTIQERLLSKKVWSYDELRELGIEPTGENMIAQGVVLNRRYMFLAYEVEGRSTIA